MKRLIALGILPLLVAACGSSPASPTPAAPTELRSVAAVAIQLSPSGVGGFTAPTSLTLSFMTRPAPGSLEKADFRMLDAQGQLLVETSVTASVGSSNPDQYFSPETVVQTFRWPAERGVGAQIDVTLTYRDANGALKTLSLSVPAR